MEAKLTRLTHKIAIQMHLVAESCTICISRFRRPVRKLLDTHTYTFNLRVLYVPFYTVRRHVDFATTIRLGLDFTGLKPS
jgi:hypothetical protein